MSFIVYTRNTSGKRVTNVRLKKANEAHRAFLADIINASPATPTRLGRHKAVALSPPSDRGTSDVIPVGGGYKRAIDDYKWRRDSVESLATIEEIERKKLRVAPPYSKGAVQYISDGADLVTMGRKL